LLLLKAGTVPKKRLFVYAVKTISYLLMPGGKGGGWHCFPEKQNFIFQKNGKR
jgi:hypothetical protein